MLSFSATSLFFEFIPFFENWKKCLISEKNALIMLICGLTLREKCRYSNLFWSVFSRIRTDIQIWTLCAVYISDSQFIFNSILENKLRNFSLGVLSFVCCIKVPLFNQFSPTLYYFGLRACSLPGYLKKEFSSGGTTSKQEFFLCCPIVWWNGCIMFFYSFERKVWSSKKGYSYWIKNYITYFLCMFYSSQSLLNK